MSEIELACAATGVCACVPAAWAETLQIPKLNKRNKTEYETSFPTAYSMVRSLWITTGQASAERSTSTIKRPPACPVCLCPRYP